MPKRIANIDKNTNSGQFLLYQDDNGVTNINVRFENEDIWLAQQQIAELFDTSRENVVQHIKHIYEDKELQEERTCKDFLQVQTEGKRSVKRNIPYYNLDMIIAVGYRVKSQVATRFRQWATQKLHYAVHKHTAAEVIYERVNAGKPMIGMTNFKGNYITKDDVKIAKNYLSERELQIFNLLVSQYLDFAELQAVEQKAMTMQQWIDKLDSILTTSNRPLLKGLGQVSHKQAIEKASKEFEEYRKKEMLQYESDFDRAIRELARDSKN